jgi:hypothetical protein
MGWYNFAFGVDVATVTVSACRFAPTQKPRQWPLRYSNGRSHLNFKNI